MSTESFINSTKHLEENSFNSYSKYKESNIKWLHKVPSSWDLTKLKFCVDRFISGQTPSTGNDDYWKDEDEGIPWVTISDLTKSFHVESTEKHISEEGKHSKRLELLPEGTLLYAIYASLGKVGILDIPAVTNQAILGLYTNKEIIKKKFLAYWLVNLENYINLYSSDNTQKNLSAQKVQNFRVALPSNKEQKAIVKFLDRETSKIDRLIEKQEKLIDLLEEKRKALISNTVTKGLDEYVEMKDSGVDWLGKIPKSWSLEKIKNISKRVKTGSTPTTSNQDYYESKDIPWYGPGSFTDKLVVGEPSKKIDHSAIKDGAAPLFKPGSVLIVIIGATVGKVAFLNKRGSANQQIISVDFEENLIESEYMAYQLKSFENVFRGIAPNTTLPNLDEQDISYFVVAVPDKQTQKEIAEYLDKEITKIDSLIKKIEAGIQRLEEYRTALISAAVTGKIDVRGEV